MLITNFSNGELSPKLNGRVDLQQYYQGASRINNFDIIPTGGIKRRTGLKRMGELHPGCRLIPFILDKDTSFILELYVGIKTIEAELDEEGNEVTPGSEAIQGYIQVWKNGVKMIGSDDQPVIIESPYNSLVETDEIQYAQNYNELIMVHKNYVPFYIKWNIDSSNFTYGEMTFNFFPEVKLDDDFDYILTTAAEPIVDIIDGVPYVDNKPYYSGVYWLNDSKLLKYNIERGIWDIISHDPEIDEELFTAPGKRPAAIAFFNNRLFFAGSKNDPQKVWASAAPDTESNRYNLFAPFQKYITVDRVLKDEDMHILSGSIAMADVDTTAGTTVIRNLTQDLTERLEKDVSEYYVNNSMLPIGVKILELTAKTMKINVAVEIEEDISVATFSVQLWRNHEVASNEDYEYKVVDNNTVTSDCSFYFEIGSSENDGIKWLASNKYLTIGTESSVWDCPTSITALSIEAIMNGRYGTDDIQALSIDTAVVFFGQGKMSIREHYYQSQNEAFQTNNIAILADHILTESAAVDFDYSINPYNRLHVVRQDGTSVNLLYDKTNGIMAWNHFTHACGALTSCCVIRGNRQNDLIFYAVEHNDGKCYLERYDDNDGVFLDSWSLYEDNAEDYGENAVLYNANSKELCEDLENIPEDFIQPDDQVYIGYKYTSDIISLPVVANDPTGKKRITNLLVRFLESYFPILKIDYQDDEVFSGDEPYSGIKNITFPGISDRDVCFQLSTDKPEAVNILVINAIVA